MIYGTEGNETVLHPAWHLLTIPQISLYFEQRLQDTLLDNENSVALRCGGHYKTGTQY